MNIAEPLIFSDFILQNIYIGGNDRKGRFQLMAGIGNKLALPLECGLHGTHGAFGQNHGKHQDDAFHYQEHQDADKQQFFQKEMFGASVGKYNQEALFQIFSKELQVAVGAVIFAAVYHVRKQGCAVFLGVIISTVQFQQVAVSIGVTEKVINGNSPLSGIIPGRIRLSARRICRIRYGSNRFRR